MWKRIGFWVLCLSLPLLSFWLLPFVFQGILWPELAEPDLSDLELKPGDLQPPQQVWLNRDAIELLRWDPYSPYDKRPQVLERYGGFSLLDDAPPSPWEPGPKGQVLVFAWQEIPKEEFSVSIDQAEGDFGSFPGATFAAEPSFPEEWRALCQPSWQVLAERHYLWMEPLVQESNPEALEEMDRILSESGRNQVHFISEIGERGSWRGDYLNRILQNETESRSLLRHGEPFLEWMETHVESALCMEVSGVGMASFLRTLLDLQFTLALHDGDLQQAKDSALRMLRLSRLIMELKSRPFYHITATPLLHAGSAALQELMLHPDLSQEELLPLFAEFPVEEDLKWHAVSYLKMEFRSWFERMYPLVLQAEPLIETPEMWWSYEKDTPQKLFPVSSFHFQMNRTLSESAEYIRQEIRGLDTPSAYAFDYDRPTAKRVPLGTLQELFAYARPNRRGQLLLEQMPWNIYPGQHRHRYQAALAEIRAFRVLEALIRYRKREGGLPERLEDLLKVDLKTLPVDPFSGKPFIYVRERQMFYSLASDCTDQKGLRPRDVFSRFESSSADMPYALSGESWGRTSAEDSSQKQDD